jgi:CRISPR/Cas system-associated exonuclease Cas4 (RecB family)
MSYNPSFLEEVAHDLGKEWQGNFTRCLVILPTTQGAEVLQRLLLAQTQKPQHLPQIVTLEAWVLQHSRSQLTPTFQLVTLLYECLQQLQPIKETFEQFYGWGCMLLQDFDIIDKCLVNAEQLFANLYEHKVLTPTYEQLSAAQKEAIQSFWNTFGTRLSTEQNDFLQFWKLLPQLYTTFTQHLLDQERGYVGLCYRMLCNNLDNELLAPYQRAAVIGFNALHPAEEKIFAWLYAQLPTRFYWDVDAYYMEDEQQEAGRYLRAHQQRPYFQASFQQPYPSRIRGTSKKITFLECDTEIGQAQLVGEQIQQLIQTQGHRMEPRQVVVVLANEKLLVPLLQALPADCPPIYTTIGYPLMHTTTYQLVEQLIAFQAALSEVDLPPGYFPTSEIIQLLQQPSIRAFDPAISTQTIKMLIKSYPHQVPQEVIIAASTLYQAMFKPVLPGIALLVYLQAILLLLAEQQVDSKPMWEGLEKQAITLLQEQLTTLQQYPQLFSNLPTDRLVKFFRQLIQPLRIKADSPITEPSIFIVRIWETANLDFESIFIIGMNEGTLPAKNGQGSFIPYNLRRGYGLPTMDTFQASLDAYYFYRLLQRSQQVQITYSTSTGGSAKKEMSRYLWQLLYESKLPIEKRKLTSTIHTTTIHPIVIQKDPSVLASLQRYLVTPGQSAHTLTPAALNTYLDCSLQFYFRYILDLQVPQQLPGEGIEAVRFGTLVHEVLEKLYASFQVINQEKLIQRSDIESLRQQLPELLGSIIAKTEQGELQGGQSIIEQEMVQKVVDKVLTLDEAYAPFELIGVEMGRKEPLITHFKLRDGKEFILQGIIDRADYKQGIVRVIDYKTGSDSSYADSIGSLFARTPRRNKAFLQTFLYAWLLQRQERYKSKQVVPTLVSTRAIFQPDFDPRLKLPLEREDVGAEVKNAAKDYAYIDAMAPYQQEFEEDLERLLTELLDPQVPFLQTDSQQICTTCPYNRICQR